jgi:hypothetical protein
VRKLEKLKVRWWLGGHVEFGHVWLGDRQTKASLPYPGISVT